MRFLFPWILTLALALSACDRAGDSTETLQPSQPAEPALARPADVPEGMDVLPGEAPDNSSNPMTAAYFHDGSVGKLQDAVRIMAKIQLDIILSDEDAADIVAFLKTLTGESPRVEFPVLPRPAGYALQWRD